MRITIFLILYLNTVSIYGQTFSESDINELAKQVNQQIKGVDFGKGFSARGCLSIGRTLIYQYDVPEYWQAPENIKEEIISNLKTAGTAETYFLNDINVDFYYYKGNSLIEKVSIKSNEFSTFNFELGEYLSIKGHPKAKNVNLKLKPPNNWKIKEGDRPNIVKKFVQGNNSYMIIVKDNITFFSRNEIRELLEDDNYVNDFIADFSSFLQNPKILGHSIITVDKYPTLVFTMKGQMERSGIRMSLIFKNWIVFYEDKIVFLQCGGLDNKEFYSLERLYNLITNSVIFPEQYN